MSIPMTSSVALMSSREIAELTEKQHPHVLRDIRTMLTQLYEGNPEMDGTDSKGFFVERREDNGQTKAIHLDREHAECLVTGYSAVLRMKVIRRLRELEEQAAKPSLPDFSDPIAAARAWADAKEAEQKALAEAEQARPAVAFVERFVTAETGSMGFRQVAKLLGANEAEFRRFLTEQKVMYRLKDGWVPFSRHQSTGRFVVKAGVARNGHAYERALFTAKGVEWVARLWSDYQQEVAA